MGSEMCIRDSDTTTPLGIDEKWRTEEGGFRLRPDFWPDLGGMDGFYIIRLNRLI